MTRVAVLVILILAAATDIAAAQLRGHGGPVRALAISPDGSEAVSGSFDTSAIRWSLRGNAAQQVLRFHDGAVDALLWLSDGRIVSSGEDARIALWRPREQKPSAVLAGHQAPVVALAVAPDGEWIASASRDRTARLWPLGRTGGPRVLEGHAQGVNGIAFSPDSGVLVTAGYDASLRIWPLRRADAPIVAMLPSPLNAVAVAPDGEIVTAGGDGKVYFLSEGGGRKGEIVAADAPIIALALSRDGRLIAAAGIRGALAGAAADPLSAFAGDPGAEVFRACVACHTLRAGDGPRAGPTLAGLFGRRIATLPGYDFSDALRRLDIVWTPETVARLFELGPIAYTPGTKMPEQRIGAAEDRAALVRFLQKATK